MSNNQLIRELVEMAQTAKGAVPRNVYCAEWGRYRAYRKAREALMALFETEGQPLNENEIKQEIVNFGGFRTGTGSIADARLLIHASIKLHLYGDGAKLWPLKMVNGLIGLKEWPDARFKMAK